MQERSSPLTPQLFIHFKIQELIISMHFIWSNVINSLATPLSPLRQGALTISADIKQTSHLWHDWLKSGGPQNHNWMVLDRLVQSQRQSFVQSHCQEQHNICTCRNGSEDALHPDMGEWEHQKQWFACPDIGRKKRAISLESTQVRTHTHWERDSSIIHHAKTIKLIETSLQQCFNNSLWKL